MVNFLRDMSYISLLTFLHEDQRVTEVRHVKKIVWYCNTAYSQTINSLLMGTGSTAPVCRTECHGCQEVQPETIVSHGNKSTPIFHSCPLMPCKLFYFSCQLFQSLSRSASLCCSHELRIYNTSVRSSRCFKIDLYFACQGDAENTYKAIFCSSAKVLPDLTLASPQQNTVGDM